MCFEQNFDSFEQNLDIYFVSLLEFDFDVAFIFGCSFICSQITLTVELIFSKVCATVFVFRYPLRIVIRLLSAVSHIQEKEKKHISLFVSLCITLPLDVVG